VPTLPRPIWKVRPRDPIAEAALGREAGIHDVTAAILIARGYDTADKIADFLRTDLAELHDPRLLPDFDRAAKVILEAILTKDLIFVHGDYDVDGVTSAAIFGRFLGKVGANVYVHVPHRMKEGYGIHESAIERAREMGAKVFLTCDCGVAAVDMVAAAKKHGMKVVVTDHHEAPEELPQADALMNPHLPDSKYPYVSLCGAGVVFKFCTGLCDELNIPVESFYRAYLDLAVLGTVADMMPITGENRTITRHGLNQLRKTQKLGLKALLGVCQLGERPLTTRDIGFKLGPRLNAAGRLDDAALSLQLLLTTDEAEANRLAKQLDEINLKRREEQALATANAIEWIEANALTDRNCIVVHNPEWHPGLVGLIAGKLVETFYRPAYALTTSPEGYIKGSARSIPGFSIYESIMDHQHLIMGGGGHQAAGGVTLPAANLQAFSDALHEYAGLRLGPEDLVPKTYVDAEIDPSESNLDVAAQLAKLEPFGMENSEPVFLCRNLQLTTLKKVGKEEAHTSFQFQDQNGKKHQGIAFYTGERYDALEQGKFVDVVFEMKAESYNGRESVKWFVNDVASSL